ncbi:peroxiredoxin-like family protein [Roseofilum casamattae]|uniref:thioredoxin-dependent peroxiredoxin n=1 Tax=Roseofilum casamattae BLCC-M143 TaxID=3022442 RepID=A0ABT7BXQ7_9CYAN|nr:peroxiredoxin-like family protein [Roseofilum casamattae]MDJ1183955.1 peroxiredoxin-like family protein [Roseofilum casamattae BLCC-M143]
MSLTQDLQNTQQEIRAGHSESIRATMDTATEQLRTSGIIEQACKTGDIAPDFSLPNATGKTVVLSELLKTGPVVVSYYRGQWCPYCNLELRALQQIVPDLRDRNATLVTISPQTPDNSLSTSEKNELTFEVLSDVGNQVARSYGLVFALPESLRPLYQNFGLDIPAHNGDDTFELPIPATYVIAPDGKVALGFVDADYTKRLDPSEILAALDAL